MVFPATCWSATDFARQPAWTQSIDWTCTTGRTSSPGQGGLSAANAWCCSCWRNWPIVCCSSAPWRSASSSGWWQLPVRTSWISLPSSCQCCPRLWTCCSCDAGRTYRSMSLGFARAVGWTLSCFASIPWLERWSVQTTHVRGSIWRWDSASTMRTVATTFALPSAWCSHWKMESVGC